MPTTINVGWSKKIGLPDYGSLGASCNVSFEASHDLLEHDLDAFHAKVKGAFVAARQAVQDELARSQQSNSASSNCHTSVNGSSNCRNGNTNGHTASRRSGGRRATASQARALRSIAERLELDLAAELHNRFGVDEPEQLSISEASQTIDSLNSSTSGVTNGRR